MKQALSSTIDPYDGNFYTKFLLNLSMSTGSYTFRGIPKLQPITSLSFSMSFLGSNTFKGPQNYNPHFP